MQRILIQGDFQPTLETALSEQVQEARARDAFAPIFVVVPSNLLRVHLRRRLGVEFGHLNVRIETLASIAQTLSFAARAERGLVPLPSLAAQLIAEAVVSAAPDDSTFAPLRRMPGFATRLLATIRDLRDAGIAAAALATAADSKKIRDFAALWSEFEKRCEAVRYCDDAAIFTLATSATSATGAATADAAPLGDGALFVYGFYDFVVVQRRLVEALLARAGGVVFTPIPVTKDSEREFEFGRPFLQRFSALGFSNHSQNVPRANITSKRIRVLAPRFRGGEAREVMREALALVDGGIAPHEIGVIYRQRVSTERVAAEARRLERTCEGAKFAFFQQGGRSAALREEARRLLLFTDALASRLKRQPTLAFLDASDSSSRAQAYARLARKAGIRGGNDVEEWHVPLSKFEARARTAGAALEEAFDDDSEGGRDIVARDGRDATQLRAILAGLFVDAQALHAATSFAGATSALRGAFARRFADSAEAVEGVFADIAMLDVTGVAYDLDTFRRLVDLALKSRTERCGSFEKGLFIGGLLGSRGLPFKAVVLPALEEGVFPRRAAQDPILSDAERRSIGKELLDANGRLPLAEATAAEERLLFHIATAAASEHVVLSCARFEDASEKPVVPSLAWRTALEAIFGGALPEGPPWKEPKLAPYFRLDSAGKWDAGDASTQPIDLEEWDRVEVARAANANDGERARFIAEISKTLAGALHGEAQRGGKGFSKYEGVLTSSAAKAVAATLLDSAIAPTTLESYAKCPFTVFARHVLRVDPADPRARDEVSFRQRGRVIHRAAQRFFEQLVKQCEPWPIDPSRRTALREDLLAFGRAALKDSAAEAPVPKVVLAGECSRIDDDLTALLDFEFKAARAERPLKFEARFGDGDRPEFVLEIDGREVRFVGSIDRIDVAPSGKQAIVVDYKTARSALSDVAGLDGGRRLQLPLYALAVMALGDEFTVERAEYFFCTVLGKGKRPGIDASGFTGAGRQALEAALGDLARAIRGGAFFADPSEESNCRFCDYDLACGLSPILHTRYERKQGDPVVAELQRLRLQRSRGKRGSKASSVGAGESSTGAES